MLHADRYFIVHTEVAKETNNIWGVTFVKNLQLSHDLATNSWFYIQHDHLLEVKEYVMYNALVYKAMQIKIPVSGPFEVQI